LQEQGAKDQDTLQQQLGRALAERNAIKSQLRQVETQHAHTDLEKEAHQESMRRELQDLQQFYRGSDTMTQLLAQTQAERNSFQKGLEDAEARHAITSAGQESQLLMLKHEVEELHKELVPAPHVDLQKTFSRELSVTRSTKNKKQRETTERRDIPRLVVGIPETPSFTSLPEVVSCEVPVKLSIDSADSLLTEVQALACEVAAESAIGAVAWVRKSAGDDQGGAGRQHDFKPSRRSLTSPRKGLPPAKKKVDSPPMTSGGKQHAATRWSAEALGCAQQRTKAATGSGAASGSTPARASSVTAPASQASQDGDSVASNSTTPRSQYSHRETRTAKNRQASTSKVQDVVLLKRWG